MPARISQVPGLPGAVLVEHRGRTTAQARHAHASLVLGRVLEGCRVLETDEATLVLEAGQAYVLPPGLAHACHDRTETRVRCLCLAPEALERLGLNPSDFTLANELPPEIRLVLERLEREPGQGCARLPQLARLAGVSPWRLSRAFRRGMGMSVPDYRAHLRLIRAKKLLARGENPAYAALEAGFFDQSHLNREFRRRVGMTPAVYARGIRGT